jgi:phenylpropionate dioxygenase-like ring-hydroxylating dioxygenase large terminal subunit
MASVLLDAEDVNPSGRLFGKLSQFFHPAARSEEVTAERPTAATLLDERIVLWRGPDGRPVAFKDLCIHRGTALSLGEVTGGRLRCAYHGWEYEAGGACVRIPSIPAGSTIPPKARAVAYHTDEAYGVVWVALENPVAPVPRFPNDEWDRPDWRGMIAFVQTWQSSAGRMLENFCDWAHLPWVHEGLLGTRGRPLTPVYEVHETPSGLAHTIEQNEPLGPDDLYSTQLTRNVFDVILPFTVHLNRQEPDKNHEAIITMSVAPVSPTASTLYLWITRNYALEPEADSQFRQFSEAVFAQDRRIVESQRPKEIPLDLREEIHLKVPDAWSLAYRRLMNERILESSEYLEA